MPDELFDVGDEVFLTLTQHYGTIVTVTIQTPRNAPDVTGVRRYAIKLDDGAIIEGVYHGIERAPR